MTINTLAEAWLNWIVAASWQLALFIGIVSLITLPLRTASPRLRYGLWLLCLIKVFAPPSLSTSWSFGNWIVSPTLTTFQAVNVQQHAPPIHANIVTSAEDAIRPWVPTPLQPVITLPVVFFSLWLLGIVSFVVILVLRYRRILDLLRIATPIDEGPLRVSLEQCALQLGLKHTPELVTTDRVTSPFLIGIFQPTIVLPEALLSALAPRPLRSILAHELSHWKHRDTWIGSVQVVAQGLFWFHPFVWWANYQLRHERESVCDAAVLAYGNVEPQEYGNTLLQVLTASRGRSLVTGSLIGVFERGTKLQTRLEEIMSFTPVSARTTWLSRFVVTAFAVLMLPLAPGDLGQQSLHAKDEAKTPYPQMIETIPKVGATEVDPEIAEIRVTFDRDMGKGMSWTGDPALMPGKVEGANARWIDARTCALPVKLEKGHYYRVGINSTSYQNFRSADGVPTPPSAIYFTTEGAPAGLTERLATPRIVSIDPENGAEDVDPKTKVLRVTFDRSMGEGMSWTGGGPEFPEQPEGKRARWSPDGRTCMLPVLLESGHEYRIGLNSRSHINFQSKWGVPLEPVLYTFRTKSD